MINSLIFNIAGKEYSYEEYKAFLEQLFGDKQDIIDHHMEQVDEFIQKREVMLADG